MFSRGVFRSFKAKIVVSILAVGILAVSIGLSVVYWVGRDQLQQAIGGQFKELASQTSQKLIHLLEHNIDEAKSLARTTEIRSMAETANRSYSTPSPDSQEIKERIQSLERALENPNPQDPFTRSLKEGPASQQIRLFLSDPIERIDHISIIVTDQNGFVIGSDAKPASVYYGDQKWWQAAFDHGRGRIYISGVELMTPNADEPGKVFGMGLVVPVMNQAGTEAIGVLRSNVQVKPFFDAVTKVKTGKTEHTMLASSDGSLVFCPIFLIRNHTLKPEFTDVIFQDQPGWAVTRTDVHYSGPLSINGFAPVRLASDFHPASLGGHQWYIFTSQNPKETYAPISALQNWIAVSGIIGAIVLSFMGVYAAGFIVKPLQDLKKGARLIGFGNLDHRLHLDTGGDIQDLADEFNDMAIKLKASYSSLEQKVAERTKELAVINKINRIISSSLNLRIIFETFTDEIGKLLSYDQIGMAILDDTRENIQTRMVRSKQGPLIVKEAPPRSKIGTAVGHVVDQSEPFIQMDSNETRGFVEDRLALREGFRSYIIVPIVSKRTVIGTLNLISNQPRTYSKKNLDILIPIAEQLAIAIDTIRLFEQTRKLDELKSDFVSKVSHELRTPLTSIKGFTEILLSYRDVDPNTQKEFLGIISEESDRLTRLINDILDLSKIEAGETGWNIIPVSISKVTDQAVKLLHPIAMKKSLQIVTEIPKNLPLIRADRDQLLQVMDNLISNAIKFTASGQIKINAVQENNHIKVMVSDTGMGIPREGVSKIFDKFHQFGDTGSGKPRGTGLGLAICKEIIDRLGGQIWCETELGKGSTFLFLLPVWAQNDSVSPPLQKDTVHHTNLRNP